MSQSSCLRNSSATPAILFCCLAITAWSVVPLPLAAQPAQPPAGELRSYDVVVVGGSTAAFAAAIAAAESGATTALLEPTDWVGGQITSSGVPAIDEAWHRVVDETTGFTVEVSQLARDPRNMPPLLRDMLAATGNPGKGWVSRYCFEPRPFLRQHLRPLANRYRDKLHIYRDTVVKSCTFDQPQGRIQSVTAIRRVPQSDLPHRGYDQLPSANLVDWYSPRDSARFAKTVFTFNAAVFIDASEWGELLALSRASYRIGLDGDDPTAERCGQSITYGFVQQMLDEPTDEVVTHDEVDHLGFGPYTNRDDAWPRIWTYRRILGAAPEPGVGDLSLQNWGFSLDLMQGGNDYPFGYLFKNRADTLAEIDDWTGGIDLNVLAAAEQRALAWHTWFKNAAPPGIDPRQIVLARHVLGTGHGLSKLPYIRDTRRSVGIGGFTLAITDLTYDASQPQPIGKVFDDRVAIGAYAADIHPLANCDYPDFMKLERQVLPFTIPLRALTNDSYGNLLVAGKTMAQDFLANSATRLHPIEWSSGTAAGVAAAHLAQSQQTTTELCRDFAEVQTQVSRLTPIDWQLQKAATTAPSQSE
jgi:hypothetical protein